MTLLHPLIFSAACIRSQPKADSVIVLASFAVAALSEQVCILLLGTFLNTRSYAHLKIATAWDRNTAERLLIGILSHWLSLGP